MARKKGWTSVASAPGGIGSPPFVTDGSNVFLSDVALTSTGLVDAPCVRAFPSGFDRSYSPNR